MRPKSLVNALYNLGFYELIRGGKYPLRNYMIYWAEYENLFFGLPPSFSSRYFFENTAATVVCRPIEIDGGERFSIADQRRIDARLVDVVNQDESNGRSSP
jgi:hypothetical protein